MSEFLQRIESALDQRRLLPRGQKLLVAVSGGADSMVLLHVLNALARKRRWKISVAHFNHHLRGRASDADEKLVRQTAAKLRLKFFGGGADVNQFAVQSKLSVEMAARKLRHEFLARIAREKQIPAVALAHHADDQMELFFLRLLRGAGGEGLAGMKWRSPSPAGGNITLVRPLLGFVKNELLEFAREHKIHFRDDDTNFSADFLRNRIRNELLPLLRQNYQPGVDKAILRLMDIVGAESEFVGEAAAKFCNCRDNEAQTKSVIRHSSFAIQPEPPHVGCYNFVDLPLAIQRKALQLELAEVGVVADFDLIEQLREAPGKSVSIASDLSVVRDALGKVHLQRQTSPGFDDAELKLELQGRAGRTEFGGRNFRWQFVLQKKFSVPRRQSGTELFDADKTGGPVILRHWQPGDRFQPIGLSKPVKLQDLFVNAKIPAARRRELVLAATAADEIFWVEGLRIGERFKLTPTTRRKLLWEWSKKHA